MQIRSLFSVSLISNVASISTIYMISQNGLQQYVDTCPCYASGNPAQVSAVIVPGAPLPASGIVQPQVANGPLVTAIPVPGSSGPVGAVPMSLISSNVVGTATDPSGVTFQTVINVYIQVSLFYSTEIDPAGSIVTVTSTSTVTTTITTTSRPVLTSSSSATPTGSATNSAAFTSSFNFGNSSLSSVGISSTTGASSIISGTVSSLDIASTTSTASTTSSVSSASSSSSAQTSTVVIPSTTSTSPANTATIQPVVVCDRTQNFVLNNGFELTVPGMTTTPLWTFELPATLEMGTSATDSRIAPYAGSYFAEVPLGGSLSQTVTGFAAGYYYSFTAEVAFIPATSSRANPNDYPSCSGNIFADGTQVGALDVGANSNSYRYRPYSDFYTGSFLANQTTFVIKANMSCDHLSPQFSGPGTFLFDNFEIRCLKKAP